MQDFSPETQAAFREMFAAIEKQYGPITDVHFCTSFEDSAEFKRIAGIGHTVYCEIPGCTNVSANCCHWCDMALCAEHSWSSISDEGRDVFSCAACFFEGE